MAAKRSSSSGKRGGSAKGTRKVPAQGVLPESSRQPKRAASSPASRKVKRTAAKSPAAERTSGASAAQARALLGLEQGTPGAGGREQGEGRASSRRAPSADDLAREAVRRERPLTGGALKDFNLRTGRDVTALRKSAASAAAPTGGRANARTTKDKGGASGRTRR